MRSRPLPQGRYVRRPGGRWVAERKADGLDRLENYGACVLICICLYLALEASL